MAMLDAQRGSNRRVSFAGLVLATLTAAGAACGPERPPGSAVLVRDSAGIRVVESSAAAWAAGQEWSVETEPALRLGIVDGDPAFQFYRLRAVDLLADGGLVVLDGSSMELRRYGSSGHHDWSAGGPGSGPGQFQQPSYIGRRVDGTFLIWDRAFARLTGIGPDGAVLGSEMHVPASGNPPNVYDVFSDGTLLATFPHSITPPGAGAVLTDTIDLWRYDPVTERRSVLTRLPGPTWIWTGRYQLPVPFTANPLRALDGARLVTASGAAPEVLVHDSSGTALARYVLPPGTLAVSDADVRTMIEYWTRHGFYGAPPAAWEEWIDRMPVPEHRPAFDRLLIGANGDIWLRRFVIDADADSTPAWDVLRSDGVYLGALATPPRLEITSIGDDRLAGVFRDDRDVEFVHVHRIRRD
jgi:hypothetical protein